MDQAERRRLDEMSARYSAQIVEHNALWEAWTAAGNALYRARQMGVLGGPDLIARREREVADAKQRLDEWERANQWNVHSAIDPKDDAERAAQLASRIAAQG